MEQRTKKGKKDRTKERENGMKGQTKEKWNEGKDRKERPKEAQGK